MDKLKTYDGSTLVEVIVALVIGSILFALGGLLFDNLWSTGKTGRAFTAEALAHAALADPVRWEVPDVSDDVQVFLMTAPHPVSPDIEILTATALSDNGDTLYTAQKLTRKHE